MRCNILETLKFIVAIAIGYTFRVMIESTRPICSIHSSQLPVRNNLAANLGDIHEQLREPYQPTGLQDVIEYRFISEDHVFDARRCGKGEEAETGQEIVRHQHMDLLHISSETMSLLNTKEGSRYILKNYLGGFERIDPLRGKEYILDMEVEAADQSPQGTLLFRMEMVKPFGSIKMASYTPVERGRPQLHMLVSGHAHNQSEMLINFLQQVEKEVFRKSLHLQLHLALFFEPPSTPGQLGPELQEEVNSLRTRYAALSAFAALHLYNITSASLSGRAYAPHRAKQWLFQTLLNQGILKKTSHLIFADVTHSLDLGFFTRCRATLLAADAAKKLSYSPVAYVPVPLVEPNNDSPKWWDRENYQLVCISVAQFQEAGGFDMLDAVAWSSDEERKLYSRIVEKKSHVIRSADPAVRVSYGQPCKLVARLKISQSRQCLVG